MTPEIHDQIMARIILPTVAGMKGAARRSAACFMPGVMLTAQGPKLFEFNVRFGDPECQALMLRMKSESCRRFWRPATAS